MRCPYCTVEFHDQRRPVLLTDHQVGGDDADGKWVLARRVCPKCKRLILHTELFNPKDPSWGSGSSSATQITLVKPRASSRPPAPPEVPAEFAEDYTEACLVLDDSPKASAALSRRCLQNILREKAGITPGNLANEIQQALDSGQLPSYIGAAIDAVRNIGNFAAHPMKSQQSGSVLPVEPGEAEWNLDVIEALFDHYFVQPAGVQQKTDALNKKLSEAGKPPMK